MRITLLTFLFSIFVLNSYAQVYVDSPKEPHPSEYTNTKSGFENVDELKNKLATQHHFIDFSSSNLPIILIDTENRVQINDEPRVKATMGIIYNENEQTNYLTDKPNHYKGNIGIELRGNSTQSFPKKPYLLSTTDDKGASYNVPLFGFPAENEWILLASYLDHTFIRNPLAMYLSQQLGRWSSRCQLVELVLNGEYQGIYIFTEKIKVDKGRLNMAKLNLEELDYPAISGGYIWEVTGSSNNFGESRYLKYPAFSEAAPEQIDYITEFDDNFRKSMLSSNYQDQTTGYPAWIDVESFVDELIVQEAMRNSDAYGWSGYFHKDKEGKINAGPVWDFDQSAGNSSYPDDGVNKGWMFSHPYTNNTPFFWPKLFNDPSFAYKVKVRWQTARQTIFKTEHLLHYIDSLANLLADAQMREFQKWPALGVDFWRETNGFMQRNTYKKEVAYLKAFLTQRWSWMDSELAKIQQPNTAIAQLHLTDKLSVYPNPAKAFLNVEFLSPPNNDCKFSIYNSMGTLVQANLLTFLDENKQLATVQLGVNCRPGLYYYTIEINNTVLITGRFVKID